jgi:hypothetical protein
MGSGVAHIGRDGGTMTRTRSRIHERIFIAAAAAITLVGNSACAVAVDGPTGPDEPTGAAAGSVTGATGASGGTGMCDFAIPVPFRAQLDSDDPNAVGDSWSQVRFVRAPCGSTPDASYWIANPPDPYGYPPPPPPDGGAAFSTPAPIPPPAVPANTRFIAAGNWNRRARMNFYGAGYTATSTIVVGDPTYLLLNRLPDFGWNTGLTWPEIQAIATTCNALPTEGDRLVCAGRNCDSGERARGGVCRNIAQCTVQAARLMGFQANTRAFSFNLTAGHVVVDVRYNGAWVVFDPTWDANQFWAL